ncbi:MAG TPA: 50S ribosomal protein L11 methyltransferase [Solirubrobacter sp.]|nr:50S ribosomal protein L11 methyltransferase [Solirubrobacter sp.]
MIRLAIRVDHVHAEAVLAELIELVPAGFEERDVEGAVEYVLYGAPGELPDIGSIRSEVAHVSSTVLPDDWDERWRSFHKPVQAGPVTVRPPWEPPGEQLDVVIEPGQAFGTGSHATTRLTLELLTTLEPAGALADWGCGSGVLAIAAAKLGWSPVLACDIELESVAAARANAAANGVTVDVTRCDVRNGGPYAPTVLANLVRPLLLEVAANLVDVPERLIISGLEVGEVGEVVAAFAGLREVARRDDGQWAAVELVRR